MSWFGSRKRAKRERLRALPVPPDWLPIIGRRVPLWSRLSRSDRDELFGHIHVFLREKRFEGCHGLVPTDEMRVTIAAQACILLLRRETEYFPTVQSIFLYPERFVVDVAEIDEDGVVSEYAEDRSGESWDMGPVVLSWEDVRLSARPAPKSYNIVLHEFAHQLDLENGVVDGMPKLPDKESVRRWSGVWSDAFDHLQADIKRGRRGPIDHYGAQSPPEFFAVMVETFFESPAALHHTYPAVYDELKRYFRQDPLVWS